MNQKRTPGPWQVCQVDGTDEVLVSGPDPRPGADIKYKVITVCEMTSLVELRLPDAQLIVRAVNAHYEAVDALRSVRTLFRPKDGLPVDVEANFRRMVQKDPVLAKVNAVLAKIES